MIYETPTLRNIYRVLPSQYDPLGLLLPYTTRAKVIVKHLWNKQREWDDPNLPPDLLYSWIQWEEELRGLPSVSFPRPYIPPAVGIDGVTRKVHIFSDASEQAYGAVAYLHTVDLAGQTYLSFLIARTGRRTEKHWGVLFKCLTTRAIQLDLLPCLSTDSFLMALWRFIARRGTPAQLWSDRGTNFRGGERELREAYAVLAPDLQRHLAGQKIHFCFNPPSSPHFGGVWEREVRSVKSALYTVLGSQSVPEEVLMTVLLEVGAILNSKLGLRVPRCG